MGMKGVNKINKITVHVFFYDDKKFNTALNNLRFVYIFNIG